MEYTLFQNAYGPYFETRYKIFRDLPVLQIIIIQTSVTNN
ncbi:16848_t:CDS:2 [Racocetra fulgida]|uniref:16848_t:CDS:1 n=1 Tax=Racocetra fulgida TaxID=60492 RepID=A0A9N8ZHV2_9GLOM|nr:16848_t:CDS:2 [Racocetra fulgida]